MSRLAKLVETVRDSEAFQELKVKYDELDGQTKLYVNLGAVAAVVLFVLLTIFISIARLNSLKSEINDNEELIGYLQSSADTIKQLKAQQTSTRGNTDTTSPLPAFIDSVITASGLDRSKIEIGAEKAGAQEKETVETLLDIKMTQVNLRHLTRLLFALTDQGAARSLNVKELSVDTKGDPTGYLDAAITVSTFKAK